MADYFPAEIEIGGQISRSQRLADDPETTVLEGLMVAIENEEVTRWDNEELVVFRDIEPEDTLFNYQDPETGYLRFRNDVATNGEMEEIESFCRKNGIPYRRWSATYAGYLGENVFFDPGMKAPLVLLCDSYGIEQVSGEVVREAIQKLDRGLTHKALDILSELCPKIPEPMPRFVTVP